MKNWQKLTIGILVIGAMFLSTDVLAKSKVLLVDSYHEGYAWSDGIVKGAQSVFGDKVELKVHRMDTKRNGSDDFKKQAALDAKAVIDSWKPDVVIACDDNASKHLVVPYLKDTALPVVFCGVNWDASVYGFPCKNVCGMEEVSLVEPLLNHLKKFAKGNKMGFLGPDIETAHKEQVNCEKKFDLKFNAVYAKNYDEWKSGFLKLQQSCDIIFIESDGGLYKEHEKDMKDFVIKNTTKPTGACYDFMAPYALFSYAKSAEEHGEWAAGASLKILEGQTPEQIGVAQNKKGQLFVNLPIAKQAGVQIPLNILQTATVIKDNGSLAKGN